MPFITIPFANPQAAYALRRQEILEAVACVLDSGQYILGPEVEDFEKSFAAYLSLPHVIGCANGTDALELALRGMGVGPGKVVFTVSHTERSGLLAHLLGCAGMARAGG